MAKSKQQRHVPHFKSEDSSEYVPTKADKKSIPTGDRRHSFKVRNGSFSAEEWSKENREAIPVDNYS